MIYVHDHLIQHSRVHDTMTLMFFNGLIRLESIFDPEKPVTNKLTVTVNSAWNFYISEFN